MPPKKRWKRRSISSNDFTSEPNFKRLPSEEQLFEFALKQLARRPHTARELKVQLLKRSESGTLVDAIIQRLTHLGYLNDRSFTEFFAQSGCESKLYGRLRIERELLARGVAPELIREVLDEQAPASKEADQLSHALERKLAAMSLPLDAKKLSRLYNHLVRQGFTDDAIQAAMERRFGDRLYYTAARKSI
jgi:regulatory protein